MRQAVIRLVVRASRWVASETIDIGQRRDGECWHVAFLRASTYLPLILGYGAR